MRMLSGIVALSLFVLPSARTAAQAPEGPARGQSCETVKKRPKESGSVFSAAAKSRAARDSLDADLTTLLTGRHPERGYLVLHVDEATGARDLESIDVKFEPALLDSISTRIANYANRRNETVVVGFPIARGAWNSDSIPLPYETCAPAIRNQPFISRLIQEQGRPFYENASSYVDFRLEARLWIFIDERGTPIATMVKNSSRNRDYDRMVKNIARRMEFYPAFRAGKTLPVWVDIPIVLMRPAAVPR